MIASGAPGGTYSPEKEGHDALTERVIAGAIAVHRELGPGMLESAYQACLRQELHAHSIAFDSEVHLPIIYRGRQLKEHFRVDLLVERQLVIEVKSVDLIAPVHLAQLLTYLRIGQFERGLLINFNVARLTKGIRRVSLKRLGGPHDVLGASGGK